MGILEFRDVTAGVSAGATIQGSFLAHGNTLEKQIMMDDHQEGVEFRKFPEGDLNQDRETIMRIIEGGIWKSRRLYV